MRFFQTLLAFLLIFNTIHAQKYAGYPAEELEVFKNTPKPGQGGVMGNCPAISDTAKYNQDYIGSGKTEVIKVLGNPLRTQYDSYSMGEAGLTTLYYDGAEMSFYDEESEYRYDMLTITQKTDPQKPCLSMSKKFNLYVGGTIPSVLLSNYENREYLDDNDSKLRYFSWTILNDDGELADYFLQIDAKKSGVLTTTWVIERIYFGPY